VGVAQELLDLAALACRSEQRTALIVLTMHQDGQKQSVIDVAGVEQRRPSRYSRSHGGVESQAPGTRIDVAVRLALMDRFEPIRVGGEGFADGVVVLRVHIAELESVPF
jgi:hypothetical protein